jgi:hypothetical protein
MSIIPVKEMTTLYQQIMETCNLDSNTGKISITDKERLNEIILEASQRTERPKKAPNAFIIFKSKLEMSKSETSGRGTMAKKAKELWDNLSIDEREKYVTEYNELKERNNREIASYNEYFGISPNEKSGKTKNVKTNPDGTPRKRGRPRKNPEATESTDNNETTAVFKCKGEVYLWNKTNDEVYDKDGEHIGYKTKNGFTEI